MLNYKYIGVQRTGRVVRGIINAGNKKAAASSVKALAVKKDFKVQRILQEKVFLYKAIKGAEKPLIGEHKAFEKTEVESALRKLGFKVIYVKKKIFDHKFKPPFKDIVIFIRICSDLLKEKLPYDEILNVIGADTTNNTLKCTIREISIDLKEGKEGKDVFGKHERIFGKFPAHMLGVASTSGNMSAVYESTARFIERDEEFKKSLRQALLMPAVVMFFMLAAIMYYVGYIFPKTVELFTKFDIEIPPMTAWTMSASEYIKDNILIYFLFLMVTIGLFLKFARSTKGRYLIDRLLIKLPYIGSLLHKTSIEIFARVFYALYSESGDNIRVIKIAAEACRNKYIESKIKLVSIPLMLKEGQGLVESLERSGVFTKTALSRFRSGAESGALKSSALQLANYYEKETSYKMKSFVDMVNISVSIVIVLVVIGLTIVSSETAVIRPKMPGFQY